MIEHWEHSGLNAREFAQQEGLNPSSLYLWRKQLKAAEAASERGGMPSAAFTEVRLSSVQPSAAAIEVVARNGRVVRVHGDVSPNTLRRVLAVVEQC